MFCRHCGAEIEAGAAICVKCGFATGMGEYNGVQNGYNQMNNSTSLENSPANGGFVFLSILIPLVGIILGIVDMCQGRKHAGKVYLITALITWAVSFLILLPFYTVLLDELF